MATTEISAQNNNGAQNNNSNDNAQNNNRYDNYVERYDNRADGSEKVRRMIDFVTYFLTTGMGDEQKVIFESLPHQNGIGTRIRVTGPWKGPDIEVTQTDLEQFKDSSDGPLGRWNAEEISDMQSQLCYGWKKGSALDSNGNEIETLVRE